MDLSNLTLAEVYERLCEAEFADDTDGAANARFEIANRGFTEDQAREAFEAAKESV